MRIRSAPPAHDAAHGRIKPWDCGQCLGKTPSEQLAVMSMSTLHGVRLAQPFDSIKCGPILTVSVDRDGCANSMLGVNHGTPAAASTAVSTERAFLRTTR